MRNTSYYELALVHPNCGNTRQMPVYEDFSDRLDTIDDNGLVSVPDGPGLGVNYDWSYIEDNHYMTRVFD